jgi:hypothetical protein
MGIVVLFLMGVDSCGAGGGGSPIGGGGGGEFEPPPEDTGDSGENGGTPGTLTDCDPQYDAVWVACSNKKDWLVHAEMNVAVSSINVAFAGTGEGNTITEVKPDTGVFEGTIPFATYGCDDPVSFDFEAFGAMLSTYECTYDYTP